MATTSATVTSSDLVNGSLPTTFNGTSVTIDGAAAYIDYVSPTQLNVEAPSDAATGSVTVTVTTAAGTASGTVTLSTVLPGLFTLGQYAAAVRVSDGAIVNGTGAAITGYTTTPSVNPGDVLELYATGLGATTPVVAPGLVFSGADPTTVTPTVSIGGIAAAVSFSGLVGAALDQINITVPSTLSAGTYAVVVTQSGVSSTGTAMLIVAASGLTSTTTTFVSSATTAAIGTSLTLTATVTPSTATGNISFYDGSTLVGTATLSSGTATLTTTALAIGTHSITAVYSGSSSYAVSTSGSTGITITASDTSSAGSCGLGTGAYVLSSGSATLASPAYSSGDQDESAVCVENYGTTLTLTNPTLSSSGNSSSTDNSSFYGLNAVLLAYGSSASTNSGSTVTVTGGSITSSGTGANGVFASGMGSTVNITGTTINVTGGNAHGLDAAQAGTLNITDVTATSTGASGSIIATDRGGGYVTISGGTYSTTGSRSAGIYTTGVITCSNAASFTTANAEGIVVEGANSLTSSQCAYSSTPNTTDNRSIFLYNSASGDAGAGTATLTMNADSYASNSSSAPLFYITNTTAKISLTGVKFTTSSSAFLTAEANSNWGTTGSNGGNVTMTTSGQTMSGAIAVDNISTVSLSLTASSVYSGTINSADTGKAVGLSLDATSSWQVTGTSYLTTLSDSAGISGTTITNIYGNGNTVYYVSASNTGLNGQTFTLAGGGYLKPM